MSWNNSFCTKELAGGFFVEDVGVVHLGFDARQKGNCSFPVLKTAATASEVGNLKSDGMGVKARVLESAVYHTSVAMQKVAAS